MNHETKGTFGAGSFTMLYVVPVFLGFVATHAALITYDTATHWGLHDRGLVRTGYKADLVLFDERTVKPGMPTVSAAANDSWRGSKGYAVDVSPTVISVVVLPAVKFPGPLATASVTWWLKSLVISVVSAGVLAPAAAAPLASLLWRSP